MVSVIIPYFNRPDKLNRCLTSILNQTYQNFEILVIDDHSTIPLTLDNDFRIKVFRNQKNSGPGLSRNIGLENSKGVYIAFLDCDDYWDSLFLQRCVEQFLENNSISMVFTNGFEINETEMILGVRRGSVSVLSSILPHILQISRQWGTGGCLWKKESIKNVKWLSTTSWEDYAFDIDVAINCNHISGIEDCLVYYDTSGNDKLSKRKSKQVIIGKSESLIHISKAILNSSFYNDSSIKKIIKLQLINSIVANIKINLKDKNLIKALINELSSWNGNGLGFYIKVLSFLPNTIQIRALRNLKGRIKR